MKFVRNYVYVYLATTTALSGCAIAPTTKSDDKAKICYQIPEGISSHSENSSEVSMTSLEKAIEKKDADYIKRVLTGKKFKVECPSSLKLMYESSQESSQRSFAEYRVAELMSQAVKKSKFRCNTDITDILIEKGIEFSAQNISDLAIRGCEKQTYSGAVHMNADSKFRDDVFKKFISGYKNEERPQAAYALGVFTSLAEKSCNSGEKSSCEAKVSFDKIYEKMKAKDEDSKKYSKEVDALRKADSNYDYYPNLCPIYFDIKFAEKRIAKEKATGRISGFVDGAKLHELGSQIVNQSRQLKNLEAEDGFKNGKVFPYNKCPKEFDTWNGTPI